MHYACFSAIVSIKGNPTLVKKMTSLCYGLETVLTYKVGLSWKTMQHPAPHISLINGKTQLLACYIKLHFTTVT